MASVNQDFTLYVGEDKGILFTVKDSSGNLFDLTGSSAEWQLSRNNISTPVITKTSPIGITYPYAASGLMLVNLNGSDSVNLWGLYYHEAAITDTSGNRKVVSNGTVKVERSTTYSY